MRIARGHDSANRGGHFEPRDGMTRAGRVERSAIATETASTAAAIATAAALAAARPWRRSTAAGTTIRCAAARTARINIAPTIEMVAGYAFNVMAEPAPRIRRNDDTVRP